MRFSSAVTLAAPLLLSACALYPLPEDVARLDTVRIVQQIRCELRDALEKHAYEPNKERPSDQAVQKELEKASKDKRLETILGQVKQMRDKHLSILRHTAFLESRTIAKIATSEEYDKVIKLKSDVMQFDCDLRGGSFCRAVGLSSERGGLNSKIREYITKNYKDSKCIMSEFDVMNGRLNSIREKGSGAIRDVDVGHKKILHATECLTRRHRFFHDENNEQWKETCRWLVERCKPGLTSVAPDHGDEENALDNDERTQRIKLTKKALLDVMKNSAIGYGFDFKMTDKDNSGLDLNFSMPFPGGSLALGPTVNEEKSRTNNRKFDYAEEVSHLWRTRRFVLRYGQIGDIPLRVRLALRTRSAHIWNWRKCRGSTRNQKGGTEQENGDSEEQSGRSGKAENDFTDELEFSTDISRGLNPVISFSGTPRELEFRLAKVTPKMGGSRKDTHKLLITFVKVDAGGSGQSITVPRDEGVPRRRTQHSGSKDRAEIYKELKPLTERRRLSCRNKMCVDSDGEAVSFVPPTSTFSGTIQCGDRVCTITPDAPVRVSPVAKALEVLQKRRYHDGLRDVIREELGR